MNTRHFIASMLLASIGLTGCGAAAPVDTPAAVEQAAASAEVEVQGYLDEAEAKKAELELLLEQKQAESAGSTSLLDFFIPTAYAQDEDTTDEDLDAEIAALVAEIQALTEAAAAAAAEEEDPATVAELLDEVAEVHDEIRETVDEAVETVDSEEVRAVLDVVRESTQAFAVEVDDARATATEAVELGVARVRIPLEASARAALESGNPAEFFLENREARLEAFEERRAERAADRQTREEEAMARIAELPEEEQDAALAQLEERQAEAQVRRAEREAAFEAFKSTMAELNAAREAGDEEAVAALKDEIKTMEVERRAEREEEKVRREAAVMERIENLPEEARAEAQAWFADMQEQRRERTEERTEFRADFEESKERFRRVLREEGVGAAREVREEIRNERIEFREEEARTLPRPLHELVDTNDGILDEDERETAAELHEERIELREEAAEMRDEFREHRDELRNELHDMADANDDGVVDEQEKQAVEAEAREMHEELMEYRDDMREQRTELREELGEYRDDLRHDMQDARAEFREHMQDKMDDMGHRADANADGGVDKKEMRNAVDNMLQQGGVELPPAAREQMEKGLDMLHERADTDGDGTVNQAERAEARDAMQEIREQRAPAQQGGVEQQAAPRGSNGGEQPRQGGRPPALDGSDQ